MAQDEERSHLVVQIQRLLETRLLDPLEILLDGDPAVGEVRRLARRRAEDWAETMTGDDRAGATHTTARLIATLFPGDGPFNPPGDFWHSPLGRTVVYQVGHPTADSVSYATAGAMLGISRQGVHDLVKRGRLPRHADGGVPVEAVRERLASTHHDIRTQKETT